MANILAVDDDRDLCTLLKTALERDGHKVETRCAGADVTAALCRWADCILLDIMMPGEDGFATCRRIRTLTEAPILFLTARTDEPSVLTGLGIGADDYLSKPFRIAELRARVNAHLRRQNRAPQHRLVRGSRLHSTAFYQVRVCHLRVSCPARRADIWQRADLRGCVRLRWHGR